MNLDQIKRVKIPRKQKKRVGRGPGSGHGKTSCRGQKGAKSRSGWGGGMWHEGGNFPMFRRLPTRGFSNAAFKKTYVAVNVGALEAFDEGATVDRAALEAQGLVRRRGEIKILGGGELSKKLVVVAAAFSASAKTKIEARGGEARLAGKAA